MPAINNNPNMLFDTRDAIRTALDLRKGKGYFQRCISHSRKYPNVISAQGGVGMHNTVVPPAEHSTLSNAVQAGP